MPGLWARGGAVAFPPENSPHSSEEPGGALQWGCPRLQAEVQPPEGPHLSAAAQPVAVPRSLTLMMTASFPTPLRILYQIPGEGQKHRFKTLFAGALHFWSKPTAGWPSQGPVLAPLVGQVRPVVTGSRLGRAWGNLVNRRAHGLYWLSGCL